MPNNQQFGQEQYFNLTKVNEVNEVNEVNA